MTKGKVTNVAASVLTRLRNRSRGRARRSRSCSSATPRSGSSIASVSRRSAIDSS